MKHERIGGGASALPIARAFLTIGGEQVNGWLVLGAEP
jgi:hypothetical protein